MIKRVSLAAVSLGVGVALVVTPTVAHAAPATSPGAAARASTPINESVTTNWGPNWNGWDVKVVNDWAEVRLGRSPTGNMHPFPRNMLARGESVDLKGYQSVLGGPANADFSIRNDAASQAIEIYLRATSSGNMSDSRCAFVRPSVGCSISRDSSKQVVVRVWRRATGRPDGG
jgi:hypothetical protein